MTRILVTGASGFVGQALCAELVGRGYLVRAAIRTNADLVPAGCEILQINNISASTDWSAALEDVDTVIHLAARVHVMRENLLNPLEEFRNVNVKGTEQLARAAAANGVTRFVYVSSVKVNGESTIDGERLNEASLPKPLDAYGRSKWEAEQVLHQIESQTGLGIVVIRPPLVYGPNVKGNFARMLEMLRQGIPLPLASVRNLRSLIYVRNLVDALIVCATTSKAVGNTYLVSDGEDMSTPDLLKYMGNAIDCPVRLFPFPLAFLNFIGRVIRRSNQVSRLVGSLRVDTSKIRNELGWIPPFSAQQGLHATGEYFVKFSKR
jgi:nucleoside-diphosphate-sugar epimerase